MRLDATMLRYLSVEDFRVLTAVEMGSKNHEVVPLTLITHISRLKSSCVIKSVSELARHRLIARVQNAKYDGYRLAYGGYDYLALHTLACRGSIVSVGSKIGVGKESDIYVAAAADGRALVLKIHRLGRVSFRAVRNKRDYQRGGANSSATSWMYLSRLAATKEDCYLRALYEHGFPVPEPVDANRHCVLMERVDAVPLSHVAEIGDTGRLFAELMHWITRLGEHGLVHSDYNEFNILVREANQAPVIIDFPQMVSTTHPNAREMFERDINCVRAYFQRRYGFISTDFPRWERDCKRIVDLDIHVQVSGATKLSRRQLRDLADFIETTRSSESAEGNELDADCSRDEKDTHNCARNHDKSGDDSNNDDDDNDNDDAEKDDDFQEEELCEAMRQTFLGEEIITAQVLLPTLTTACRKEKDPLCDTNHETTSAESIVESLQAEEEHDKNQYIDEENNNRSFRPFMDKDDADLDVDSQQDMSANAQLGLGQDPLGAAASRRNLMPTDEIRARVSRALDKSSGPGQFKSRENKNKSRHGHAREKGKIRDAIKNYEV